MTDFIVPTPSHSASYSPLLSSLHSSYPNSCSSLSSLSLSSSRSDSPYLDTDSPSPPYSDSSFPHPDSDSNFDPNLNSDSNYSLSENVIIEDESIILEEPIYPLITDFDSMKVSTITLLAILNGEIGKLEIYQFLPITRINLPVKKRSVTKYKLPESIPPGAIVSVRYRDQTRGIIRSNVKTYFRNTITIDIGTTKKTLSLKSSKEKVQICGASSIEDGIEAVGYIIKIVNKIEPAMKVIREGGKLLQDTLDWLAQNGRGPEIVRHNYSEHESETGIPIIIDDPMDDHELLPLHVNMIPGYISYALADFLIDQSKEYIYFSDFVDKVNFVLNLAVKSYPQLNLIQIPEVMVNYNYSLGIKIDRFGLCYHTNGYDGFYAHYDNCLDSYVTIELAYDPKENPFYRKKGGRKPRNTFLVYRSGSVTQSGPHKKMVRSVYYRFMNMIEKYKPLITLDLTVGRSRTEANKAREAMGTNEVSGFDEVNGGVGGINNNGCNGYGQNEFFNDDDYGYSLPIINECD